MAYSDYDIDATTKDTVFDSIKMGGPPDIQTSDYTTPADRGPHFGQFRFNDPQTIDMSDAAVTLTVRRAASATQITSNALIVDPNSAGISENLLLPPEADCYGLQLSIANNGGEGINIQNDAGTTLMILPAGAFATVMCDGTTWRGQIGYQTNSLGAGVVTERISFTEDGSTTLTGTVELPAGARLIDILISITVLFDDSGAVTMDVGDDDDANGWFAAINMKATDLVVGELLSIMHGDLWGGKEGAYLVAATGRRGRTTAGVDSGTYYGAASEVIGVITTANQDGTAGRAFMDVIYSVPTAVAATGA